MRFVNQARWKLYCVQEEGVLSEAESQGYPKDKLVFVNVVTAVVASCVPAVQENLITNLLGEGREGLPELRAGASASSTASRQGRASALQNFWKSSLGVLEFLSMRCMQRGISESTWNYLFSVFCYVFPCFVGSLCLFLVLGAPVLNSYTGSIIIIIINSFSK